MTDDQGTGAPRSADTGMQVDDATRPVERPGHAAPDRAADARADDAPAPARPVREWTATAAAEPTQEVERPTPATREDAPTVATAATTGAGSAAGTPAGATTVLPGERRPQRPGAPRDARAASAAPRQAAARPAGRGRRARLVLQRVDPWSVFLFSLVASLCLGVVLLVAVAALYLALDVLGVLASVNGVLGEVVGSDGEVGAPLFTVGRVMGVTAVLAAVDVVIITALATLSALLYNLCASLTGGVEVVLGERD